MDLLGGPGGQMGPSIDFRTILDAPGVALGGLGAPLGSLGARSGAPSGRKSGKNTELCDHYVLKACRVMKTGSPDPPNVVKT